MLAAPGRIRPLAVTGAALALLATLLTGCTEGEPAQALPDGATLVTEAAAAMRDVKSAHVTIDIEGRSAPCRSSGPRVTCCATATPRARSSCPSSAALIEYEFVVVGESIYLKGVTGGWQQLPAVDGGRRSTTRRRSSTRTAASRRSSPPRPSR